MDNVIGLELWYHKSKEKYVATCGPSIDQRELCQLTSPNFSLFTFLSVNRKIITFGLLFFFKNFKVLNIFYKKNSYITYLVSFRCKYVKLFNCLNILSWKSKWNNQDSRHKHAIDWNILKFVETVSIRKLAFWWQFVLSVEEFWWNCMSAAKI